MSTSVESIIQWHANLAKNARSMLKLYPEATVVEGRVFEVRELAYADVSDVLIQDGLVYACRWFGDPGEGGVCLRRHAYCAPTAEDVVRKLGLSVLVVLR